ncbi:MAG: hypothetical protein J0L70_27130 [Leptolyngbya sp. UWPOB_LEPTO1]|uniref:hypothetical protein n=1 Tax=Leptolyngbya sp. UWPOB_LEPTO1 TaxID=2815653 RepID=UPI001AD042AF|nr:hypothetical protein [Leptolyngbya sp. UWPOB_LEPTO1]MBN8564211.1 hypothetical protein [Leptolyngbya sp. UWPOB_LEPTO1]
MSIKRLVYGAIVVTLSGVLIWQIAPSFSNESSWQPASQIAPPGLLQRLQQDYAPHIPSNATVDVRQMQMLKLQQSGSLPLYLVNTRIHTSGNQKKTPTCGFGGCLFLGYIPDNSSFKQVFNGLINDFQVQGKPPVIKPIARTMNRVPCFQLTTYNPRTGKSNPTQTLCFNGGDFTPVGGKVKYP